MMIAKAIRLCAAAAAVGILATVATADIVRIEVHGSVEWNQFTSGTLAGVQVGDPVFMQFDVDSTVFYNPPTIPTWRGYPLLQPTFTLQFSGASPITVGLRNPMPAGATP